MEACACECVADGELTDLQIFRHRLTEKGIMSTDHRTVM